MAAQVKSEVLLMRNEPHLTHLTARHVTPVSEVTHAGNVRTVTQQDVECLQAEAGRPLYLNVLQHCQAARLGQIEECLICYVSHTPEVDGLDVRSCPQQPFDYT